MLIRLGLLDTDLCYTTKLADYFSYHYSRDIEVLQFTDAAALMISLQRHERLDVLLASPEALADPSGLPERLQFAYLSGEKDLTSIEGIPVICKYQRADALYRAVQGLAGNIDSGKKRYMTGESCRVILFMGAVGGIGCSTAALSCASRIAAKGTSTLYMNLQSHGRTDEVFSAVGAPMTRVLYELKSWLQINKKSGQNSDNIGRLQAKLRSLTMVDPEYKVINFGGYDLPLESMDMSSDDFDALIKAMPGICECCIIDMDGIFNPLLLTAMKCADDVVIVGDGTAKGNQCLEKVLRSIEILNGTDTPVLKGALHVLYTHFGSAAVQIQLPDYANLLGCIPNYSGSDEKRIVNELIGNRVFEQLE